MLLFWMTVTFPLLVPYLIGILADPGPGLFRSLRDTRSLECHYMSQDEAAEKKPETVANTGGKSLYFEDQYIYCAQNVFLPGERIPRDEMILSQLSQTTRNAAALAIDKFPETKMWLVQTQYADNLNLAQKFDFAAKIELKNRGAGVSDRIPLLSASDILTTLSQNFFESSGMICEKWKVSPEYFQTKPAILTLFTLSDKETQMHAGVCAEGSWTWLF